MTPERAIAIRKAQQGNLDEYAITFAISPTTGEVKVRFGKGFRSGADFGGEEEIRVDVEFGKGHKKTWISAEAPEKTESGTLYKIVEE